MSVILLFIRNLMLTVLIEWAVMLFFSRNLSTLYHSVLVNMLTNPLVNLFLVLWTGFMPLPEKPFYFLALAFAELSALIAEGFLYGKMGDFGLKKAFFVSAFLNFCSFTAGILLF